MKTHKIIGASAALLTATFALAACSTTTTTAYQKPNGIYQVTSLSRHQSDGIRAAMAKANKICATQNKQAIVLRNSSVYQGSNKQLGEATAIASQAIFDATGNYIPSTQQNNDYKSIVVFKCR